MVLNVKVTWRGGMSFDGVGPSSHQVRMDAAPSVGGLDRGPRPTELLLMAVGGCTGIDMVSILGKMKVEFESLEIDIEGSQAEDHPRRFNHLEIVYRLRGKDLPRDKVERAAQLSQDKYCSVSQSLLGRADIAWRVDLPTD